MKNLTKILCLVLSICLCFCFAGCGEKKEDTIKIGVQTATTGDIYSSDDFGEGSVIRYDSGAAAVEALKAGKIDVVIIDNEPAKSYVEANTGLKILETEYVKEDYAICFQKGDEMKDTVDAALKALIDDGSIQKIMDKYVNNPDASTHIGVPIKAVDTDKPNLSMVTNAEFPPYEYIDGDNFYGVDVEVAKAIADKLGYDLIIENVQFEAIIPGVQSGKYTMGMAGMTVTNERLEEVDFTSSYATGIQVVITSENSKIQSFADLEKFMQS